MIQSLQLCSCRHKPPCVTRSHRLDAHRPFRSLLVASNGSFSSVSQCGSVWLAVVPDVPESSWTVLGASLTWLSVSMQETPQTLVYRLPFVCPLHEDICSPWIRKMVSCPTVQRAKILQPSWTCIKEQHLGTVSVERRLLELRGHLYFTPSFIWTVKISFTWFDVFKKSL